MKAIEILYNLSPYQNVLQQLLEKESKEQPELEWSACLKSSYDFITLELESKPKEAKAYGELFLKISFQVRQNKALLDEVYCKDAGKQEIIENWIKANKNVHDAHWHNNPNNTWYHNENVTGYINIADDIAKEGCNCNSGDNYRPGSFSKIAVHNDAIILEQINHYNAKSSDHKDDYQLRDLIFHVPLSEQAKVPEMHDYQIGEMYIEFSDRSSKNNKSCGQKIVEQILQQKAAINLQK
ncbi:MAG: hypothetical protein JWO58_648 [Chitinophagaceae bacterium]|nr:hypothetical protein [Chitinophagaceae bacterium]